MGRTAKEIMEMIRENEIQMIDFKIVDINGQFRHVTIPASQFSEETLKDGIGFDASNYGYAVVEKATWFLFLIWIQLWWIPSVRFQLYPLPVMP